MNRSITEFRGVHRFLSNFYIEPDGTHVEGEYQAQKTDPPNWYLTALSPSGARFVGQRLVLRPNWEEMKLSIMGQLVLRKFEDHPSLNRALRATADAYLEEGNTWGDTYWGVCEGIGHNHLGKTLMRVRSLLCPPFV